jgi:hypothetical protein
MEDLPSEAYVAPAVALHAKGESVMRKWQVIALVATLLMGLHGTANAIIISLGVISSPGSHAVQNSGLLGEFTDQYTFSVASGSAFDISAFISTGFSNRYGIVDMVGSLLQGNTVLFSVDAVINTLPEGFPSTDLTIRPFFLRSGDYRLVVTGNAYAIFEGPTASYSGRVMFDPAPTSVPEPGTLLLLATGLIAVVALTRRRSGRRPDRKSLRH